MTRKSTVSLDTVVPLGAEKLAQLILDEVESNPAFRNSRHRRRQCSLRHPAHGGWRGFDRTGIFPNFRGLASGPRGQLIGYPQWKFAERGRRFQDL